MHGDDIFKGSRTNIPYESCLTSRTELIKNTMDLKDDFHTKIPVVIKKIRDSQLAGRLFKDGTLEYFICGSPFDYEREKQHWGDKSFVKAYKLEKLIVLAFQDVGIIKNAKTYGYMGGSNFKFELVQPDFNNFCNLFKRNKVDFEYRNGKYACKGFKSLNKTSGENPEEENIYQHKAKKYSYSNFGNVYFEGRRFNVGERLAFIVRELINRDPEGATAEQLIALYQERLKKKKIKELKRQAFRQYISEIRQSSLKHFGKDFIVHSRGKNEKYHLSHGLGNT